MTHFRRTHRHAAVFVIFLLATVTASQASMRGSFSATDQLAWPVVGKIISWFDTGKNNGIIIAVRRNAGVSVVSGGVVTAVGNGSDGHQTIVVDHGDGWQSTYSNVAPVAVKLGDVLRRDDVLGQTSEARLFVGLLKDGTPVNPVGFFGRFRWPVEGFAAQGMHPGRDKGLDISLAAGAPVRAAADGVVAYAANELRGYGQMVLVRHDDGYVSAYAFLRQLEVHRGDAVSRGALIGQVSDHDFHFEVRKGSAPVDARWLLPGAQ